MRIRTIKPEFWTDEKLSKVSEFAHLMAAALLNYADDEGYFNANYRLVECSLFPLREPSMSIHGAFNELSNIGYLQISEQPNGQRFGKICNFAKHQVICRPQKSKFSEGFELGTLQFNDDSMSIHGAFNDRSLTEQGTGNREWNREQGKENTPILKDTPKGVVSHPGGVCETKQKNPPRAFVAPTVQEVQAYAGEYIAEKRLVNCGFSPEQFVAFYDANGWKVGRNAMKDWRAAVRTWLIKDAYRAGKTGELASVKSEREFVL